MATRNAATKKDEHYEDVAIRRMQGDLVDALLDEFKQSSGLPWSAMPESQQADLIERLQKRCAHLTTQVVNIIASRGFAPVQLVVEQFAVKDGVKVVLKGAADLTTIEQLTLAKGASALVVLADHESFLAAEGLPRPEPDQRALIDDQKPDA